MSHNFDILAEAAAHAGPFPRESSRTASAVAPKAAHTAAHDEIARLVHRVFLSRPYGEAHKAVIFCGIDSGAGCSWVCAKAAELLATRGTGRVCAVDGNLRSASLHVYFGTEIGPGLAESMRQTEPIEDFLHATSSDQLWLMTAGKAATEPNGALNQARLRERFAELRHKFDFLLIDAPAIARYSDALILGQLGDGVVLVIASNRTRRETARVAKNNFEDLDIPVLGAVLNQRTYPIPEAVYRRL